MERLDRLLFRYRNPIAGAPLAYALASTRWECEQAWVLWPPGVALCLFGVALRSWAAAHCAYGQVRAKQLTTSGPYAHVRNPLYLGSLLIVAGATIASGLAWLLPIGLAWSWLVYDRAVRHEERRLRARFGDAYARYRERVPAWLPPLRLPVYAIGRQLPALLLLLLFAAKQLNVFGLWSHP